MKTYGRRAKNKQQHHSNQAGWPEVGFGKCWISQLFADKAWVTGQCLRTHFDDLSAFRPCGRDLVEFFKSAGWALYGRL